jgi:hypothetical protein
MPVEHAPSVEVNRAAVVGFKKTITLFRQDFLDDRLLHSLLGFHRALLTACIVLKLAAHLLKCFMNGLLPLFVHYYIVQLVLYSISPSFLLSRLLGVCRLVLLGCFDDTAEVLWALGPSERRRILAVLIQRSKKDLKDLLLRYFWTLWVKACLVRMLNKHSIMFIQEACAAV